jgi:hypothetical protein
MGLSVLAKGVTLGPHSRSALTQKLGSQGLILTMTDSRRHYGPFSHTSYVKIAYGSTTETGRTLWCFGEGRAGVLGHSSTVTTRIYARIADKMTENPAAYLEAMLGDDVE